MKRLYNYSAEVKRVVDGDTFDCLVDMGMKVYHKARIRIMGVDTPERGEKGYEESKQHSIDRLGGKRVYISCNSYDSFGRWLAWVWIGEPRGDWDLTQSYAEELKKWEK